MKDEQAETLIAALREVSEQLSHARQAHARMEQRLDQQAGQLREIRALLASLLPTGTVS